jgi:hypothetical protein
MTLFFNPISESWIYKLYKQKTMKEEELEKKIQILEIEIEQLKLQLQPFLEELNRRNKFIEKRDEIDGKIAKMMANFHNQNK